jgi:predicted AlkP superfamily pyrophosphatase or phosphodiesterase
VKVLLVVIDAATPRVVGPAIKTGRLPVLQRLVEAGTLHESSTTIFPSITPAATTSILTGEYPATSGILGASWFDESSKNVAYYGDDFWVIAREGFRSFLDDFLIGLNGVRLIAPTLFEMVEGQGLRAACLNYLIFKGLYDHKVKVPHTLSILPGVKRTEIIKGPSIICLGDFIATRTMRGKPLDDVGGILHRFGMDDASTSELLFEIAEDGEFPDFTVAYYADNDYRSHEVGPYAALETVERVDRGLGRAFEAAGGIEKVLEDMFVIVTSDHGHCEVLADRDRAAIHLDETLADFQQAKLGKPWVDGDDIMICPNMRAAQIYFREATAATVRRAVGNILSNERVEHAIYRGKDVEGIPDHFWIESTRGRLEFWRGGAGDAHGCDAYGNVWSWRGDLAIIDSCLDDTEVVWHDFPNAFERVAGILDSPNSGTLWVTAKPGCEFEVPGGEGHYGASSHGGLHALESLCPVIIAGPRRITLPRNFRSVDIAPLCMELLGLSMRHRVGEPRRARVL